MFDGVRQFLDSLRWPTRDEAIVSACLGWATFEIIGEARPSVLAFVTTILTMVVAVKAETIRRNHPDREAA